MTLERMVRGGSLHPNKVSAYGLGFAGAAAAAGAAASGAAPWLYMGAMACDWADGYLARRYKVQTKEGAILDPFVDKAKNGIIGGLTLYLECVQNPLLAVASKGALLASYVANFGVDAISQGNRGPDQLYRCTQAVIHPQQCAPDIETHSKLRANWLGKFKTGIQNVCHLAYLTYLSNPHVTDCLGENSHEKFIGGISAALVTSAVLGAIGIRRRTKKQTL